MSTKKLNCLTFAFYIYLGSDEFLIDSLRNATCFRPKKEIYVFGVTCSKKLGSVGG